MFKNRIEAANALARELQHYRDDHGIVLAIPRGGVPIGYIIAKKIGFDLEVLLSKKIGHPHNREYAIGAVSLNDRYVVPHPDVPPDYIEKETENIRLRLKEMYKKFMGSRKPADLKGKTVIVTDDGIATGSTLMSILPLLRKSGGKKIIVAVPVAPQSTLNKIAPLADEILALLVPRHFYGVGQFYEHFDQIDDETVTRLLNDFQTHSEKNL